MPTRNINLTPQIDAFVEKSVSTGQYQNASEVVRDALRLLQLRQREDKLKLQRLRQAVDAGLADLESGNYVELVDGDVSGWLSRLGRPSSKNARR